MAEREIADYSEQKTAESPRKNRELDDEMTGARGAGGLVRGELIPDSTHKQRDTALSEWRVVTLGMGRWMGVHRHCNILG